MTKYHLTQSTAQPGWWIVTDTERGIVCRFEQHRFNATQHYTLLEDLPDRSPQLADDLARVANGIADWLAVFHYDLAMGEADEIEAPQTTGGEGLRMGAFIYPVGKLTARQRIGRQVAYFRKAAGLSQHQLAAASGVTWQNISKVETGKYNVSVDILARLCKPLGVELTLTPRP